MGISGLHLNSLKQNPCGLDLADLIPLRTSWSRVDKWTGGSLGDLYFVWWCWNKQKNFAKGDNRKMKLSAWRSHKLPLFGWCLIAKTLGLSQIVYLASMLDITKNYTSIIQSLLFQFIWKNKPDKIKSQVFCLDYCVGGLWVTTEEWSYGSGTSLLKLIFLQASYRTTVISFVFQAFS